MSEDEKPTRMTTRANFGTYAFKNVPPDEITSGRLSAGWYSLSSLSTVPYVSLIGQEGREKIFSWGELIQIPDGSMASVKNASFHTGDIIINGGQDYATLPHRVTVPVVVERTGGGEDPINIQAPFVDTRRARRAWFVMNVIDAGLTNGNALVLGANITHSNPTNGFITFTGGSGFVSGHTLLAHGQYCYIPLGYCSEIGMEESMVLLDKGRVIYTLDSEANVAFPNIGYYVLEY